MECEIFTMYPGGDHTLVLGKVQCAEVLQPKKKPLFFHRGGYVRIQP